MRTFRIGPGKLDAYPGGVEWKCHFPADAGPLLFSRPSVVVHTHDGHCHAHERRGIDKRGIRLGPQISVEVT